MKKALPIVLLAVVITAMFSCKPKSSTTESADIEKQLQEKFVNAKDGEVIELPEGTFKLNRSLVLDKVNNITIRGKGKDKSILDFGGQKDGAEGLRITANNVVMEDFGVINAKGDCIKVQDATNVTFRRLNVGWTSLHDTKNGSYGTYPVGCTGVLIEDCEVYGSSDAGIYVGQSKNIIVRRNNVHDNVAGIEIENSTDADVYENTAQNNTGGVLVFDLPNLPVKNGSRCRIYNNAIINNNTGNFGPKGTTVSEIPGGTGIIIMATNDCEVFGNKIMGHNSVSAAVISYQSLQKPFADSLYDPFAGGVHIHDNTIVRGEGGLDTKVAFGLLFKGQFGDKVPEVVWDGLVSPANRNNDGTIKENQKICIKNNGEIEFANMNLGDKMPKINRDPKQVDCSINPLTEVKLNL